MTAERRLAKLEGVLSPKAATLLWLAEVHQFASLPAYVTWLIDQPISVAPLERVPTQARAGALEAMRGQPREAVREAAHAAVRDAIFLVELVLKVNVAAEETIRIGGLRYAALFWEMRAIGAEAQLESAEPSRGTNARRRARGPAWRLSVASLVVSIYAAEEARVQLERRFLGGTSILFPDLGADWLRLHDQAERLAGLGALVGATTAMVDRARRSRPQIDVRQLLVAAAHRAPEEAASFVDAAWAAALDTLGDTDGAATILQRRLQAERGNWAKLSSEPRLPKPERLVEPQMGSDCA
jgi:hypothetical protein